ncbi:hypothetical protein GQ53DRAFT_756864 [Thozetella sp. PMI_491]|nr:hypothetical protein GQ53DRAFT_756864 [Thozetella sp. PMI_491]
MDLGQVHKQSLAGPRIERSVTLNFMGDWGMANFHRICSWLTQQFCDRAGKESQVAIWNVRHGGLEAVTSVYDGRVHMAIATPARLMGTALAGEGIFTPHGPMPTLRALGVLPQNDRIVFAIDPKFGIHSFDELRRKKPAIRIATSANDGTNFIGHIAHTYLKVHGIDEGELASWGAKIVTSTRPEQAAGMVMAGEADVLLQEAIMTPWWEQVVEGRGFTPLPAEATALARFDREYPGQANPDADPLPAGHWTALAQPLPCLDFSDFVLLVRDDLPEDIAYLLTWCLVETRGSVEAQYSHLRPERSPLSYPLIPEKMAQTPVPLHPGALRYYQDSGVLQAGGGI